MVRKQKGCNKPLAEVLVANGRALQPLPILYRGTPPGPDEYREDMAFALAAFHLTGHGAFLWRAYASARKAKVPIPTQVLAYLDDCAYAVRFCRTDTEITSRMLLRHARGGARPGKRLAAAYRQVEILQDLLQEYRKVSAGQVASKLQARRNVAVRFGRSPAAILQLQNDAGL